MRSSRSDACNNAATSDVVDNAGMASQGDVVEQPSEQMARRRFVEAVLFRTAQSMLATERTSAAASSQRRLTIVVVEWDAFQLPRSIADVGNRDGRPS